MLLKSRFVEMFGDPILESKNLKISSLLSDFCDLKAGDFTSAKDISESQTEETPYPCFGGNGIRGYVDNYTKEGIFPIIGRQGALCGNVNLSFGKFRNTEHAVLVTPKNQMNTVWLFKKLELLNLNRLSIGAAQPGLSVGNLNKIPFTVPSIEEQNKYAEIYKQLDKLKVILNQIDEKIELLKKSRFVEMFGTPVTNNKKWETVPLKQACSLITDGSHFSPEAEENGEYPMLSVKDMGENNFNYDECKYIGKETFNNLVSNGCCPQKNDVLVAKDGSYWKKAFVVNEDKKQVLLSSIAILRPDNQKISSRFLRDYVLSKEITSLVDRQFVTGTALKRVILKGIREIPIYLPPIELQKKYEKQVNQLDKLKVAIHKELELIG